MTYEKYVAIVHETDKAYIATIWTGPNYYIGWFPKSEVDGYIRYAEECGHYVSLEAAIQHTHVDEMHHMCQTQDYSTELQQEWIDHFLAIDKMEA